MCCDISYSRQFSAFVRSFLCCVVPEAAESQVSTTQTPPTECAFYLLCVVITKKTPQKQNSTCQVSKVVIRRIGTFLLFNIAEFS